MAKSTSKKENAVLAYLRSTRAEMGRVRWPTLDQGWSMTKIVLAVTFSMAIFLGVLDFFFGWLLGQIVSGSVIFMVVGAAVAAALIVSLYLIGQSDEA